ncbi:MAG: SDR family NAD(P)-dependent oxidoreductase [Bacteroidota bacterium]
MNSNFFNKNNFVITGGTDGMGAASAIEFCRLGANVHIIGRSEEKAIALSEKVKGYSGKLFYWISDFSLMKNVEKTVNDIASKIPHIDYIIHSVGILITNTQHTKEGLEKDFAVSYLSRFVFNELLHKNDKISSKTKILNIAASSPKVPSYAQMEFDNITEVTARVGMKSHGQAQLANDLYTELAAKRYSIVSIGYGPGSVDTSIRREIPKFFRAVMKPFFYFSTRKPEDVAQHFVEILSANNLKFGNSYFYNKMGQFEISDFITDKKRQSDLLHISKTLSQKALIL